jgi:serine protease
MVAGTAALMHAANGRLSPEQLIRRMQQGATPFPPNSSTNIPTCQVPLPGEPDQLECYCTTQTCGAGIVNTGGAVTHALRPVASIQLPSTIAPGQDVPLDASASAAACNRSIASYEWTVVSSTGTAPVLSATNQASALVQAPASGEFTLRVTVTDDIGQQDSADVTIGSASANTTALPILNEAACPVPLSISTISPPANPSPPANNGGGGGGGQLGWEVLALVLLVVRRLAGARSDTQPSKGS